MNYREATGKTIREAFELFDKENPQIYKEFEMQALKAIENGRQKISAKLILNWIRWNKQVETKGDSFKINDAFQSYFPRKFVRRYPQHMGVFDFRKLRNEVDGPYMEKVDGEFRFL